MLPSVWFCLPQLSVCYFALFHTRPPLLFFFFFFNDPPTPEIYPLPLHAALPISCRKLCPIPAAGPANLATTPARGTRLLRLRSLAHPCTHVHCPHAVGQSLSYRFRGKLVCGPVLSASHLRQRGHGHARLGGRARA